MMGACAATRWGAVRGACGTWGTVHVRDHGESPPATSAACWTSQWSGPEPYTPRATGFPVMPALCCLAPRPAAACRPALFSLCVVCAQTKLPLLHAAAALLLWPIELASCRASYALACFREKCWPTSACIVTVDRWQLSSSPIFFINPWHRAPYVFMRFRCIFHLVLHVFHLDVAYVALAIHVCCKCMF
jgi:hypothetical protein